MKYANRKGFAFTVAIGDNELNSNTAELKNMQTGETIPVTLDDKIIEAIDNAIVKETMKELEETIEKDKIFNS